jgi:hypothetical protein
MPEEGVEPTRGVNPLDSERLTRVFEVGAFGCVWASFRENPRIAADPRTRKSPFRPHVLCQTRVREELETVASSFTGYRFARRSRDVRLVESTFIVHAGSGATERHGADQRFRF